MDLTHKDVQDIIKMIDAAEHLNEIELALGGFRLHVVRNPAANSPAPSLHSAPLPRQAQVAPARITPAAAAGAISVSTADAIVPEGVIAIRAPMLGTFYRAPAPNEKPFVEVGQQVNADDTVCMIEVMKLFNSIRAGVNGTVTKILVENGGMVEFNQVLIHIAPSK